MTTPKFENTWGLYPWFRESGEHLIHPDDRSNDPANRYYGRVFFCSGVTEDGYLILNFAGKEFRVKPDLYHPFNAPMFNFDDYVRYKAKPERTGIILEINWHDKNAREMYKLLINGKRAKKRYWSDDLELIEKANR